MERRAFIKGLMLSGLSVLIPAEGTQIVYESYDYKRHEALADLVEEMMDIVSKSFAVPRHILFQSYEEQ